MLNEEESIEILYTEILNNIKGYEYELIFIDDGSKDKSYEIMSRLASEDEHVKTVKFRKNFGKSAALNIGFQKSTGDIVFTIDADLQDDPSEIKTFLKVIEEENSADIVTGWKKNRKDRLSRRIASKIFNFVVSTFFGLKLRDYNSGFKAYKKCVVKELDIYGELHRYIPVLAWSKGFTVVEIPINHRVRRYGKSKYGSERFLRGYLDLLTVKLVTSFDRSPLYLFGGIGTLLTGSGVLLGLYLTILRVSHISYLSNRPLLFLCMLLIIVGLQFLSIGLIGELVVNQFRRFVSKERETIKKETL